MIPLLKIRNSPLFFLPLLLFVGFILASWINTLIMRNDGWISNSIDQAEYTTASYVKQNYSDQQQVLSDVSVTTTPIYLLNSKNTRDYFNSTGGNYDLILDQWHYYFQAQEIKFHDIRDEDLKSSMKPGILVLPSSVALGAQELSAIDDFEHNGGSVLATWATGARNGAGEWVGYNFLSNQFGIKVSDEFPSQENDRFLVVFGDTPVTHTLPAGTRIWLGKIHEHPLRVSGGNSFAGLFMDAVRTPKPDTANQAIVYTDDGHSRRVYFGFSENSWQFEQQNIYELLNDVFDWLNHRPTAYLASWPTPFRSAQIIEMDTEQGFNNAVKLADILDSSEFKGTFYSLTSVATKYPGVVKNIETHHEIAFHGDVHTAFKGQSEDVQSKRIDAMRQELEPLVSAPSRLTGFRPPYELSDQKTESILFKKGYRHILSNSDGTQSMLPYISAASPNNFQSGLIVLPRTQRDDMNFLKEGGNAAVMTKEMNDDFDQAVKIGALGVLSVHSQNFEVDSPVALSTAELLTHIKSSGNSAWVASSGSIDSWWRERAQIKSSLTGNLHRMLLNITIANGELKQSASIIVLNPVKGVPPTIRATKVSMSLPGLVLLDEYRTAIIINAMSAGDYSYYLSY
jgi:peptidoglycan/xylan/chitin deacetylase (PgdA/CDA1 family)